MGVYSIIPARVGSGGTGSPTHPAASDLILILAAALGAWHFTGMFIRVPRSIPQYELRQTCLASVERSLADQPGGVEDLFRSNARPPVTG